MNDYIEITPEQDRLLPGLGELWRYRDLVILLTRKSFTLSYKQTVLGPLWLVITPLMSSGLYSIVFGGIAGIRTDGVPQFLFYLCNNGLWTLFASCLSGNANVFRANAGIFGKVYFPRLAVPISNVLVSLIKFGIQFVLILGLLLWYAARGEVRPQWQAWILVPLVLVYISLLGMSLGILASSLTTKYRDLSILVSFGVRLWMYVTPVVYPLSAVEGSVMRFFVMMNPVTAPMELFRRILLGSGSLEPFSIACSICFFLLFVTGGTMVFHRVERTFMDSV